MKNVELILPFSLPPAEHAKDLLKALQTPALAKFLGKARREHFPQQDAFQRALPHEYWLVGDFPPAANSSPGLSWNQMQALGLEPEAGFWFNLTPVHIHVARDHLVLTDPRRLAINEEESRALFSLAQAAANEEGFSLLYGDAHLWFLRADAWQDLQTATLDAACGHNIDIWMPQGEQARAWRKLQNEIQMLWHGHALNEAREQNGLRTINSVWLSAGNRHPLKLPASSAQIIPNLLEPALNSDWGRWLDAFAALDREQLQPLLTALERGEIKRLDLIASDAQNLIKFSLTTGARWQFWRRPSLQALVTA